ncbi:MAG: hypothetical protein IAG13_05435 [Deltaproteobacteria bacterium]|nr:hypothetical protein [Nannocystaceae bacterium]
MRIALALIVLVACDDKEAAPAARASPAGEDLGAMTEYMRKSKGAEAKVMLAGIARSVVSASQNEHFGPDGTVTAMALVAAPMTPAAGSCCKQPQGKCTPNPADWQQPGWQAISFAMTEPHYYSYELVVDAAGFMARAVGDLDCDGELATFELRGTAKPDGSYEIAAKPTLQNELE